MMHVATAQLISGDFVLGNNLLMDAYLADPASIRDISPLLLDNVGQLRVVPASELANTTAQERLLFGVRHGLYSFPTEELCDFLRNRIKGKVAIEVGAGHGTLAKALKIPATDSRVQEEATVKAHYQQIGQPTVPYGEHVEKLDAVSAVQKYKPNVVIGCWVTHVFDERRPDAGGNMFGIDEAKLIASCDEYIVVGNEQVHAHKPIWAIQHEKLRPPWLYSRAVNGSRDFIAIWRRGAAT